MIRGYRGMILLALTLLGQGTMATAGDGPKPELIGNMGAAFAPENYPPAALRAREEGLVVADLTIDTHGLVVGCKILESASTALDEQTCRIVMSRADLFRAAKDKRGKAMIGHYALRVRWSLPGGDTEFHEVARSGSTISELTVDADGRVSDCRVYTMPGHNVIPDIPCPPSVAGLQKAVMEHSGSRTPPRFHYMGFTDRIFDDGSVINDEVPEGAVVLQRYRVDFAIDATGKAVDCRVSISLSGGGVPHGPMRCEAGRAFVKDQIMPKSGYDQVQWVYQILPPSP